MTSYDFVWKCRARREAFPSFTYVAQISASRLTESECDFKGTCELEPFNNLRVASCQTPNSANQID